MAKVKTTDIGRGVQYAQVKDRLMEFHQRYDGEILTQYNDGVFTAMVKVYSEGQTQRSFTGHAKVGTGAKALEKAETVAVGRALAFLGIMADGSIATAEEMDDYAEEIIGSEFDDETQSQYDKARYHIDDLLEQLQLEDNEIPHIIKARNTGSLDEMRSAFRELWAIRDSRGLPSKTKANKIVKQKLEDE